MPKHIYGLQHYLSYGLYALAGAAIVAGSVVTGTAFLSPLISFAIGSVLVGGLVGLSIPAQKKYFENNLVEHPQSHEFSPRLGQIVDDVRKRAGFKWGRLAVYDFKGDEKKKTSLMGELLNEMFKKVAMTPNAAMFHMGKPVIMISEPLLKLLDDEEERAVISHEFAHAAAKHSIVRLPVSTLTGVAAAANVATLFTAFLHTGWTGFGTIVLLSTLVSLAKKKLTPDGHLLDKKDDTLSTYELYKKKKLDKLGKFPLKVAHIAILSALYPPYLAVSLTVNGLSALTSFVNKRMSRHQEFQADRGAVVLGADPLALITALRKLTVISERARETYIPESKNPLTKAIKSLNATHPPLKQRVAKLAGMAKRQGVPTEAINRAVKGPIDVPITHNLSEEVVRNMMMAI